jgi:hypothetical protein
MQQRCIAFVAHLLQDASRGRIDRVILLGIKGEQFGEGCLKLRIA